MTPISEMGSRVGRQFPADNSGWFGPLQPLPPMAPAPSSGRRNDYQVGYNMVVTPGANGSSVTPEFFAILRRVAANYSPLTMVIQTQVDKLGCLPWAVKPKKGKKPSKQTDRLNAFFASPDGEHTLSEWVRILAWEMLTTDAPAIHVPRYSDGAVAMLRPIDGSTIKVLIDEHGFRPLAPAPAYSQVIKGMPSFQYTTRDLIYKPRNIRVDQIYGWSPVAQIISIVALAMNRQSQQMSFFDAGSVPDAFATCPESWQPDQIKKMQVYWDAMMAGNLAARAGGLRFIPYGVEPKPFKIDPMLKQEFDEWMMRLICYQFGTVPQPFVREMNRATAEQGKANADEEGQKPRIQWVKELGDHILRQFLGDQDHEFGLELDENLEPEVAAKVASTLFNGTPSSILTKNEARAIVGHEPVDGGDEFPEPPPAPVADPGEKIPVGDEKESKPGEGTKPADNASDSKKDAKKACSCHAHDIAKVDAVPEDERLFATALDKLMGSAAKEAELAALSAFDRLMLPAADSPFLSDAWFDAFVKDSTPHLSEATLSGVESAKEMVIEAGKKAPAKVVAVAEDGANAWATSRAAWMVGRTENPEYRIDDMMRQAIAAKVQQAIAEGWTANKLSQAISSDFAFSPARALNIARTEIGNAARAGQKAMYKASKVKFKEWLLAEGGCLVCETNRDAGAIPIDDAFPAGDDPHPACRCGIKPVFEVTP